jgi:hypothetical protein
MEDTVPTLRIVTTSAVFLTLAAGSASAQTATTTAPGKPLPLLQIFQKNEESTAAVTPHHRARYARRRATRTRVANHTSGATRHAYMEVQPSPEPAQSETTQPTTIQAAAATAAPANIWPTPDFTLPGTEGLTATPAAAPLVVNPPAGPIAASPNEVLAAAYHTVQATPQAVPQVTPPSTAQMTPPNTVRVAQATMVNSTDAVADPPHEAANVAKASVIPTGPVQHAMVATVEPQNPNPVGSPIWIVQVLAALGGAIAAGGVAWFLINPLPARRYE